MDALQYLTARIISHQQGRPVRVSVDAGGYRRRRRESLEDLALSMARKARQSGRPTSVGPLAAPERRLVHLALKDEEGINTTSRGRGGIEKSFDHTKITTAPEGVMDPPSVFSGYNLEDTIAAVATASGPGGVAIVRISGPEALRVGSSLFFAFP